MRSNNNNTMKKVISLLLFVSFAIMGRSADYTTFLTAQRGFTEVTSTSQILTGDYYYVIASAENTELIVTVGPYAAKPGWASENSKALHYKAVISDPIMDRTNIFTIEKHDEYIALFSIAYPLDAFQTHDGASYMYVNTFTCQGDNVKEWGGLKPTWYNDSWIFEEAKYSGNFLGPWNNVVHDGEAIAGNRTNVVGDEAGHYRLFRISKADLRKAQMDNLQTASNNTPLDATFLITNPSFETGDTTGWTPTGDVENNGEIGAKTSVTSNGDGNYTFNSFQWWSGLSISQTAYIPSGIYDVSAVVAAWEIDNVTFSAGNSSLTNVGLGDMTGIPVTLQSVVVGSDNSLTISASSNADWWSDGRSPESNWQYACGFFKLDNVQLVCKGLFLTGIAQPLPNDESSILEAGQWYYYDVPASGKYILTGSLFGMVYTQECETPIAEVSENPTKGEMGFNGGRVFFKTKRSDATLKVEPATSIITFTAATLNVDGLPLTLSFPIVGDKDINPDGPGTDGTKLISSYIANKQIDVVAFQEDFNYNTELKSSMGGYSFGTHRSSITTDIIYTRPVDTDGLQFATRSTAASFSNEGITQFTNSYSEDEINLAQFKANIKDGNSLIKKGYRYYEVTVGGEKIDVYITHDDAGMTDQSSTDPFVVSRGKQLKQIAEAIIANGNTDRPKIFMGDTNCRWTREDIKANFFDILSGNYDVSDTWVELYHNNEYPLPGQSTINEEVVDKIIYINPKGNNVMKLTPISYERDATNYVNGSGNPLSDHAPVIAKFGLGLYEEVDNTLILGDVNKDGQISIADVTALVNIILGKDSTSPYIYDHVAADVNQDGSISIADVTALVNIILGKEG